MPDISARFSAAFAIVVGVEGGFGADRTDAGDWTGGAVGVGVCAGTKYGISAASYPTLDIAALTLADAQAIYHRDYWTPIAGDALPAPLALVAFDAAVNQGVGCAARWVQSAAWVTRDGVIGPETLAAVAADDALDLLSEVVWLRDVSYRLDAGWPLYGHGWIRRLAKMAALSGTYDREPAGHLPHSGRVT